MRRTTVLGRCSVVAPALVAALAVTSGPASAALTYTATATTFDIMSDSAADTINVSCLSGNLAVSGTSYNTACSALKELDVQDAAYPVTIALRAVKKG